MVPVAWARAKAGSGQQQRQRGRHLRHFQCAPHVLPPVSDPYGEISGEDFDGNEEERPDGGSAEEEDAHRKGDLPFIWNALKG